MWLHGFGFPRYRGGLMFWADTIGVARGLQPDRSLAPALRRALEAVELLQELAESGGALREVKTR